MITKTEAVLDLVIFEEDWLWEELIDYAVENPDSASIPFEIPGVDVDDDGEIAPLRVVNLSLNDWHDLGRPKTITVTIVPGNLMEDPNG